MLTRRDLIVRTAGLGLLPFAAARFADAAVPTLRVTGFDLVPVRATSRTVWLNVLLRTDTGLVGIGEASDAFGFANTTADNVATMRAQLQKLFALVERQSPFGVERFRQQGWPIARGGLVPATAFSALEQALWDLAGQALGVPTYILFGGRVRDSIPVYANVNRAASPRTPAGFAAAARRAVADGFRAVKAAPFDGFPAPGSPQAAIDAAVAAGIDAMVAIREAVGPDVHVMVDCHSFFDVALAVRVATRLEPQRLRWYEEPVPPENVTDTLVIKGRITAPMAGGETLFGLAGFRPLIERRSVDVIMPDVKHCGGLLELSRITALAADYGVSVAPHNPSGPISTAASLQACAGHPNVEFLELQYGEAPWRPEVVAPAERFVDGRMVLSDRPGFGITLDEQAVRRHGLSL